MPSGVVLLQNQYCPQSSGIYQEAPRDTTSVKCFPSPCEFILCLKIVNHVKSYNHRLFGGTGVLASTFYKVDVHYVHFLSNYKAHNKSWDANHAVFTAVIQLSAFLQSEVGHIPQIRRLTLAMLLPHHSCSYRL